MILPVAILAGGLATRLGSRTATMPKSLLEVAGRPFAEHQLTLLRARGIERVVFCVGHLGERIRETIGDGGRFGLDVRYAFDGERLLGTGGALRRARPMLDEAFFVLYGDSYLDCDYAAVAAAFHAAGRPALMTVFRNEGRWDASNVLFAEGRIVRYDKGRAAPGVDIPAPATMPIVAPATMQHIDYGLGVIESRVFDPYEPAEPLDLATVYADLLGRDELAGFEVPTRFYEIGSPSGLAETSQHLAERTNP